VNNGTCEETTKGVTVLKRARFDAGRFIQGVILFGFSVYLIKMFETGDIHRLVSPRIALLLEITLVLLVVMTFYALATIFTKVESCGHDHDHPHAHDHEHHDSSACEHDHRPQPRKGWVLLVLPIMLGLCVPTESLGTSMLNNSLQVKKELAYLASKSQAAPSTQATKTTAQPPANGIPVEKTATTTANPSHTTTSGTKSSSNFVDLAKVPRQPLVDNKKPPKPTPGTEISLLDLWNNLMLTPEYYYNQNFTYSGFVYHPPGWPTNRMVLTRYLITCCVADATPVGVTVETNEAAKYADNSWLQLSGPLSTRLITDASSTVPLSWYQGTDNQPTVLAQTIKPIPEPKDPYLYLSSKNKSSSGGK
jgi:putative membrane protein